MTVTADTSAGRPEHQPCQDSSGILRQAAKAAEECSHTSAPASALPLQGPSKAAQQKEEDAGPPSTQGS